MKRASLWRPALLVAAVAALWLSPGPSRSAANEPPFHITADNMTGGRGEDGDVLFLNGNLRVVRGRTVLTADNGRYHSGTGLIDLMGRVRLVDTSTTVTCEHASFSENDDRLNLDGSVVLRDHDATLKAPVGWYDRRTGTAWMGGGVIGREKQQRLAADEATYLRDSMLVKARGHVQGWDDENDLELDAKSIDFDRRTKVAVATGEPQMRSKDSDGKLTVLSARLLRVDSGTKIAEAIDSVLIVRDTLRARADRATFDDRTGRGLLLGSPRAWDSETMVTGDTLETLAEERKLRRVVVRGNAIMDYAGGRENNRGETSRLTGARVDAFVVEDRIDSLMATGKAVNAYTSIGKPGRTRERNTASGDTIMVFFKDKKVDRARVIGSAAGEYHAAVDSTDTLAIAKEVVRYDGRRIDFIVPRNKIVLDGQAHLIYREIELTARRVEFDSDKQTLVAQGNPKILERDESVNGQLMTYDLESRSGTIYQAQTSYERGLYRGDRIRKVGDNQLDVLHGSYSTCDLENPHYHFSSRWMKVYLRDKLVAKPVVFYLRNIPIMALPFYVFPIKPGRHSGFLFPSFEFGFSDRAGQFIRNAGYYWAPNDYMDLSVAGDYYQALPSWVIRGDGNYKLLYKFDGHFEGRFERNESVPRDDYAIEAYHTQDVTPRTRLIATGNFISSREYNNGTSYAGTLAQRLNRFLTSSVSMSHSADWVSLSAVTDRRQDLDADQSITDTDGFGSAVKKVPGTLASLPNLTTSAPALSIAFPQRTVGSWGLFKDTKMETTFATTYVSLSARALSLTTRQGYVGPRTYQISGTDTAFTTSVLQSSTTRRGAVANFSVADARRLWGWLNVTPGLFGNAVVFDHDVLGKKFAPALTWSSALGASTTYYGTFKPPIPRLAGLRHVIFPSVSFAYSPDAPSLQYRDSAGVSQNRFQGFGGIGVSASKSAAMSFSIDQRFQVKLKDGDKVTRLDNLLGWSTFGSYDFLYRDHARKHGLAPLTTVFQLQPPGFVQASLSGQVDPYEGRPLTNMGYNVNMNFGSSGARKQPASLAVEKTARKDEIAPEEDFRETWRVSFAYSYSGGYAGPRWSSQRSANLGLSYQMTPNWLIDYSTAYDVTRAELLAQRFSLTRRIHCWDAVFTRSFGLNGSAEYYFRLGVRDQREIYFERGTRAQSLGGL